MSTQRNASHDFSALAEAFNLNPVDAANLVLERVRAGKAVPSRLRRAARAITRRAKAA